MAVMNLCCRVKLVLFTIIMCIVCLKYVSCKNIQTLEDGNIRIQIDTAKKWDNWSSVYNILPNSLSLWKLENCVGLDLLKAAVKNPSVMKSLKSKLKLCNNKDSNTVSKVLSQNRANDSRLLRAINKRQTYAPIRTPPFVSIDDGNTMIEDGFPLLIKALNANSQIFNPSGTVNDNFNSRLNDVYNYITGNWKPVNNKICKDFQSYVDTFCRTTDSMDDFFQKVIRTYNDESLFGVNKALIRQGIIYGYTPDSTEMNVGAYALTLDAILTYWTGLEKITDTTYSAINIDESEDMAKYQIGTTFTWLSFTSASIVETESFDLKNTLFVIDNSQESLWQPKDVRSILDIRDDIDVLYPVGTQFRVTDLTSSRLQTRIYIELINNVDGLHKKHVSSIIISFCLFIVLNQ